ncbi:putative gastrolith protein 18.2-like 1, partial [Homarus americanus]
VCVLLAVAGTSSAQIVRGSTILNQRPGKQTADTAQVPATLAADPSPIASAPAAPTASTPAGGSAATQASKQQNLGRGFFGPGLNNPLAIPVSPFVAQHAQKVLKMRPDYRVFVDIDGTAHFTDMFGREVEEFLDPFGNDMSELLDLQEQQERLFDAQLERQQLLQETRQREFDRRRQLLELQLLQQFQTNPTAFDPSIGASLGAGGNLGAGVGLGTSQTQSGHRFSG